jgi:hypothetical protein
VGTVDCLPQQQRFDVVQRHLVNIVAFTEKRVAHAVRMSENVIANHGMEPLRRAASPHASNPVRPRG